NTTCAEWRAVLMSDLKPEVRIEAIKALSAFAPNGYGKDAAQAIIEVMRGYDIDNPDPDDSRLIGEALTAFLKVRSERVPILTDELRHGKTNARRFAITALQQVRPDALKAAVPAIIDACKDADASVRYGAIMT